MSDRPTRRTVLASATLVPLTALAVRSQPAPVFSAAQLATLEAFADRLVPSDETGPGARECGAVNYIANTLSDFAAAEKPHFIAGLASLDEAARKSHDAAFADLMPAQQDEVLTAFEKDSRPFFNRVRRLTLEGMFSDPYYGGNSEFAGWDLIRYPGPRLAALAERAEDSRSHQGGPCPRLTEEQHGH